MTKEELKQSARFQVGDTVYVNGLEKATVVTRFYRRSARTIMYQVRTRYGMADVEQARLKVEPGGVDPFATASTRGRR